MHKYTGAFTHISMPRGPRQGRLFFFSSREVFLTYTCKVNLFPQDIPSVKNQVLSEVLLICYSEISTEHLATGHGFFEEKISLLKHFKKF